MARISLCAIVFVVLSPRTSPGQISPTQGGYSVQAEVVDSSGAPIPWAILELRPQRLHGTGWHAAVGPKGRVVIPSVQPDFYDVSFEAGGFNTLSATITIQDDKDFGRIVMDVDPSVGYVSSGAILGPPPERASEAAPVPVGPNPSTFRGRIQSASLAGRTLTVQLSCSEQLPKMPERPQWEVARFRVHGAGIFEGSIPPCSGEMLAHRELRFALKDDRGATIAQLLPRMTLEGYQLSKIGICLPLRTVLEPAPIHEATFVPEFTHNRPLQATLSLSPPGHAFHVEQMVLLNLTIRNTSLFHREY